MALWVCIRGVEIIVLPLLGIVGGAALLGGVTIAVIGKEINSDEETMADKAESSLIKIGYFSEGMVKGAIISVPVCAVVLIGLNITLKVQKRLVGGV